MGTNTPHTCIPGLVWQKKARRFSQYELKVGELGFPIHFVCVSARHYTTGGGGGGGYTAAIFPLGEYGPLHDQDQPSSYSFLHTDMHSPLDSIPHTLGRMHAPVHRCTCIQHVCTHTRSHAPSIPQQTFCCFYVYLFLSLFLFVSSVCIKIFSRRRSSYITTTRACE